MKKENCAMESEEKRENILSLSFELRLCPDLTGLNRGMKLVLAESIDQCKS